VEKETVVIAPHVILCIAHIEEKTQGLLGAWKGLSDSMKESGKGFDHIRSMNLSMILCHGIFLQGFCYHDPF
jgi:hypothetical protein